ncbi:hypothetical protein R1flu_018177 [Riccia fluitans]|uniref:Uncharacterized protein n=1 Tax=Riccia fluitans TaxID=41844 RepID=A0ABD1ZII5_9MARC
MGNFTTGRFNDYPLQPSNARWGILLRADSNTTHFNLATQMLWQTEKPSEMIAKLNKETNMRTTEGGRADRKRSAGFYNNTNTMGRFKDQGTISSVHFNLASQMLFQTEKRCETNAKLNKEMNTRMTEGGHADRKKKCRHRIRRRTLEKSSHCRTPSVNPRVLAPFRQAAAIEGACPPSLMRQASNQKLMIDQQREREESNRPDKASDENDFQNQKKQEHEDEQSGTE